MMSRLHQGVPFLSASFISQDHHQPTQKGDFLNSNQQSKYLCFAIVRNDFVICFYYLMIHKLFNL